MFKTKLKDHLMMKPCQTVKTKSSNLPPHPTPSQHPSNKRNTKKTTRVYIEAKVACGWDGLGY
jgi:hypothetical protein